MKTLLFSLAVSCASAAVLPAQAPAVGFQSMKMNAVDLPAFPAALQARGVTRGTVRVVAKVSPEGRLDDWLVVAYSDASLARSAVESLQRWEFTPARLNGEPVPAQSEVVFSFRAEGVVVSQNLVDHFLAHARGTSDPELVYQPCTLQQLDRIPTPIHVVNPMYDAAMAARGLQGEVTVDFYIDEQGAVRLPVVNALQQQDLAALAMEAVRQWKFEPPTRRGRPVLVQARQRFHFNPPTSGAAGGATPPAAVAMGE